MKTAGKLFEVVKDTGASVTVTMWYEGFVVECRAPNGWRARGTGEDEQTAVRECVRHMLQTTTEPFQALRAALREVL